MSKNVVVTGHTGFIGHHLVKLLKENTDWYVIGASRTTEKYKSGVDEEIISDLYNYDSCNSVCKDVDYVFHLAADMGGVGYLSSNIAETTHNSLQINLNMLNAASKNSVQKFLFSSSACVYNINLAISAEHKFKEEDAYPAFPDKGYGWAKLMTEQMCQYYQTDGKIPEIFIPRFHTIYGPVIDYYSPKAKAPPAIAKKIIDAVDYIDVWGNGEQQRSFLYIDDCVKSVWKLFNTKYYDPINIGSDKSITIKELTNKLISISGKDLRINYDLSKPEGPKFRNSDNDKSIKIIDFKETVDYNTGLKNMFNWIKKDYEKNNLVL